MRRARALLVFWICVAVFIVLGLLVPLFLCLGAAAPRAAPERAFHEEAPRAAR